MGGSWGAVRMWARADLRSRWASVVVVGVLAGVTGGLALGCFVGAQRTGNVLERLQEATNASDVVVFPSNVGFFEPDWTALEGRPEVGELARWALVFGDIEGEEAEDELFFAPVGDEWMQQIDRPVVVRGRIFDPNADDELVVAEGAADQLDIDVGTTVSFTPYTSADLEHVADGLPPTGPHLTMRVVGVIRTPIEPLFVAEGLVIASPGLLTRHPEIGYLENAVVQLDPDHGDAFDLQQHASRDVVDGVPVLDLEAVSRRVTTTTDVERTVLAILAAVILLVGLVLVGQVVARSAAGLSGDAGTLRAMGLSRRAIAAGSTLAHAPALVMATAACVGAMFGTAAVLPFGLAGRLEPDQGLPIDVVAMAVGVAGLVALLVAGTFFTAWGAASPRPSIATPAAGGFVGWVRRHASPAVGLGTTMALRRSEGRNGVPVRPALAGAIVGVLGVAAAVTVDAGLRDAVDHPERAGVAWDAQVRPGEAVTFEQDGIPPAFVAEVRGLDEVEDLVLIDHAATAVGDIGMQAYALRDAGAGEGIRLVAVEGRGPRAPGEIALGPETADELGVDVGDAVEVGTSAEAARVVGLALFPASVHAEFDEGIWLHPMDFERSLREDARENVERLVAVRFAAGIDEGDGIAALHTVAERSGGFAEPSEVPPELHNLRDVLPLPRWLAAFLAALAVAAALHVLAASARARRKDFAVLRAIGMTRRGTRLVLNVQGVAIFAAGLVAGIPLGIAAGRVAWRVIAASVPLEEVLPFAAIAIAVLVPATLLVSQLVAVIPGRRLRRLHPAEVLRSE